MWPNLCQFARNLLCWFVCRIKCLPYQKKPTVSSQLERDQGDLQLSGSDCCCVLSNLFFFFLNRFNSTSSTCQSQKPPVAAACWGSRTESVYLTTERASARERIIVDGRVYVTWSKCCFRGLSTPAKKKNLSIYDGGNTGLKCFWICHLLSHKNNV